jgi:hypothetical protein
MVAAQLPQVHLPLCRKVINRRFFGAKCRGNSLPLSGKSLLLEESQRLNADARP